MHLRKLVLSLCVLAAMTALMAGQAERTSPSGRAMALAATRFLDSLTGPQRERLSFSFSDPERLNWHFIPRPRKGLPLKALNHTQLDAAKQLLASGLSSTGYEQALSVVSLEEVLYLLEEGNRAERRQRRDPQNYYLSLFGTPSDKGTWGWRFEGHHVSLNYTIVDGDVAASTPEFFGANPAMVDAGPGRSIRVLSTEEDLARQILKLAGPTQPQVWLSKEAPDDIRGGGAAQPETTAPVGLPVSQMNADQQRLMKQLVDEYLKNMPDDVERKRRNELTQAGLDNIYFAWWGSQEPNERHAYRVQGPTFLIEYNNTQNNANHLHTVWRNLAGDFNVPLGKGR